MRLRSVCGEGVTAADALSAIDLGDWEVDDAGGVIVIHVKRTQVRKLGSDETFDGFVAEVVR